MTSAELPRGGPGSPEARPGRLPEERFRRRGFPGGKGTAI